MRSDDAPPPPSIGARSAAAAEAPPPVEKPQKPKRILAALAGLFVLGLTLLLVDRGLASDIEARSAALADHQVHLEQVTRLQAECRRVQVALLERWLASPDSRDARGRRVLAMMERARSGAATFDELPATSLEEAEFRPRMTAAVTRWADRVQSAVQTGQGPSSLGELTTLLEHIDLWADRVRELNSQGGQDAAAELRILHGRRSATQLAFGVTIVVTIFFAIWWRGRVRAETRYLEQKRLDQERAAGLRAEFFANMSHELRTPLVAIGGFADVVEANPGIDLATRNAVRQIQRTAKDLLGIINNILDLSKLESGHVELLIEDLSLEEILERCVMRCQGLIGVKPVELKLEMPSAIPAVRGDFVKLQQVFTNLIGNAIKFTETGRVTVRAKSAPGHRVVVEVEDTGVGIRPDSLKSIWEPFRQADYKVSRKFGGTGLGLAIVSGVVRRLGGTVSVESTVGIGTTFSVSLPAQSGPPVSIGPAPASAGPNTLRLPPQ